MAVVDNPSDREALALAIDIRRGFKRFTEVPVADRPHVARILSRLTDAKLQEMLGAREMHGGHGIASHSRVG
jgi:hypothetical protein